MIKHVCDLCGKDIFNYSPEIYFRMPFFEKTYAKNVKGIKMAELTTGIKPREIELCPDCITNIARIMEKINENSK